MKNTWLLNFKRIFRRKYYTELYFQPRLMRRLLMTKEVSKNILLPWDVKIKIHPFEFIGKHIWYLGLYDICTCEAIFRLLDPGDRAVDVGANIGQMASLMSKRIGRYGHLVAFEPHPKIYGELKENVTIWSRISQMSSISVYQTALSTKAGKAILVDPEDFNVNQGGAYLITKTDGTILSKSVYEVEVKPLDFFFSINDRIGLLKLDVEGHELEVLMGSMGLIRRKQIRDIIFEDHAETPYPTSITEFLEANGYTLFYLAKNFLGPEIGYLKSGIQKYKDWAYYNCIATLEPERLFDRFRKKGWSILR